MNIYLQMRSIEFFNLKLNAITIAFKNKALTAELNTTAEVYPDYLENLIVADV